MFESKVGRQIAFTGLSAVAALAAACSAPAIAGGQAAIDGQPTSTPVPSRPDDGEGNGTKEKFYPPKLDVGDSFKADSPNIPSQYRTAASKITEAMRTVGYESDEGFTPLKVEYGSFSGDYVFGPPIANMASIPGGQLQYVSWNGEVVPVVSRLPSDIREEVQNEDGTTSFVNRRALDWRALSPEGMQTVLDGMKEGKPVKMGDPKMYGGVVMSLVFREGKTEEGFYKALAQAATPEDVSRVHGEFLSTWDFFGQDQTHILSVPFKKPNGKTAATPEVNDLLIAAAGNALQSAGDFLFGGLLPKVAEASSPTDTPPPPTAAPTVKPAEVPPPTQEPTKIAVVPTAVPPTAEPTQKPDNPPSTTENSTAKIVQEFLEGKLPLTEELFLDPLNKPVEVGNTRVFEGTPGETRKAGRVVLVMLDAKTIDNQVVLLVGTQDPSTKQRVTIPVVIGNKDAKYLNRAYFFVSNLNTLFDKENVRPKLLPSQDVAAQLNERFKGKPFQTSFTLEEYTDILNNKNAPADVITEYQTILFTRVPANNAFVFDPIGLAGKIGVSNLDDLTQEQLDSAPFSPGIIKVWGGNASQ